MLSVEELENLTTAEKLRKCAASGMSKSETAKLLGVSRPYVTQAAAIYDIKFRDGRQNNWTPERRRQHSEMAYRRMGVEPRTEEQG